MTTEHTPSEAELAASLNGFERELLLGSSQRWGSWMFMVGSELVAKGLGRRDNGSIYLDTPLAGRVRAILKEQAQ